jgi:hypothetical protein
VEYIEKEEEFDKKEVKSKIREINMKVDPKNLGFNWKTYISSTPKPNLSRKFLIN